MPPAVFDVRQYGAVGWDGIADDSIPITAAIRAAERAGGGLVLFPPGVYACLAVEGRPGVTLSGAGAVLRKRGGGTSTHILDLRGRVGEPVARLAADVEAGGTRLALHAAGGFRAGDCVVVRDDEHIAPSSGRNMELGRVRAVDAGGLEVAVPLIGRYAVARRAEVARVDPWSGVVQGLTLEVPDGVAGGNLYVEYGYGGTIQSCTLTGPCDDAGVLVERSAFIEIAHCTVRDGQQPGSRGYGNGFEVSESSHHCSIHHCATEAISESTFGWRARYCSFSNNMDRGSYDSMINTHGQGVEHVLIHGNLSQGSRQDGIAVGFGSHLAGDCGISIIGNVIVDCGDTGISVAAPAGRENRDVVVAGNLVRRPGRRRTAATGIVVANSRDVEVRGNEIVGDGRTVAQAVLVAAGRDVSVVGNRIRSLPAGYGIVYTGESDGLVIAENVLSGVASSNVRREGDGGGRVRISGNVSDTGPVAVGAADRREGNAWGRALERNGGAVRMRDGAAVPHGLAGCPRVVQVTGSVAGEITSVTDVSDDVFTVAIRRPSGEAGTPQTIFWTAQL